MPKMSSSAGTCTIHFTSDDEKARAFYELVHSKARFSGIGKDTLVVQKKDCTLLKSKNIKYNIIK
jgi:hypothetical protein